MLLLSVDHALNGDVSVADYFKAWLPLQRNIPISRFSFSFFWCVILFFWGISFGGKGVFFGGVRRTSNSPKVSARTTTKTRNWKCSKGQFSDREP